MSDDVMKIEAANKLCMKNWDENGYNHNDFIRLVKVDDYLCITCNHKVNTERLLLIKLKENNSIHLLADNLLSKSHTESKISEIDWISID
jgi:hypothetical protein